MKRIIAAVSFALLTVPAFADAGKPFEQLDVDRALPNLVERPTVYAAASGDTRSDASIATDVSSGSVWANDHNVVAPAQ
jgi:hypothetical protein